MFKKTFILIVVSLFLDSMCATKGRTIAHWQFNEQSGRRLSRIPISKTVTWPRSSATYPTEQLPRSMCATPNPGTWMSGKTIHPWITIHKIILERGIRC